MKNSNDIPEGYKEAIRSGKIEFAELNHPRNSAIRQINLLRSLELAGIVLPKEPISGEEIDKLMTLVESRGVRVPNIPFNNLSEVECRAIVRSLQGETKTLVTKALRTGSITDNMNDRQKEIYHTHLMYKNGYTLKRGKWIKV